jgi:hypothetical protein
VLLAALFPEEAFWSAVELWLAVVLVEAFWSVLLGVVVLAGGFCAVVVLEAAFWSVLLGVVVLAEDAAF